MDLAKALLNLLPDNRLTLDERWELACSVGIECIQPEELKNLLDKKPNPVAYDGFEPSGRMHIAQACPSYNFTFSGQAGRSCHYACRTCKVIRRKLLLNKMMACRVL